jgi:hypothetical protein
MQPLVDRIPVEIVELKRAARGWGDMVVRLNLPEDWDLSSVQMQSSACTLKLSDAEVDHRLSIRRWTREPIRFSGIPFGTYSAQFHSSDGMLGTPAEFGVETIEIGPRDAEVAIDLRGKTSLEVVLADEQGASYEGGVCLWMKSQTTPRRPSQYIRFERGPFRIFGIEPGEYEVLARLKMDWDLVRCSSNVTIKARENAKLRMNYVN